MVILDTTSKVIRIVTSASTVVEVHASYVDWDGATSTPGSTNTSISTNTTTTVVAAPASSVQRNVKSLFVFNTDASTPNTVTVEIYDGSVGANLYKVTLAAGESFSYDG